MLRQTVTLATAILYCIFLQVIELLDWLWLKKCEVNEVKPVKKPSCVDDTWVYEEGQCFKLFPTSTNWTNARVRINPTIEAHKGESV